MIMIDINFGDPVEFDNLNEAIKDAEYYREFKHVNTGFEDFDKTLNALWQDIYEKLKAIESKKEIDSYGCTLCQNRHYECDRLYTGHLNHQSKQGIEKYPNPYL